MTTERAFFMRKRAELDRAKACLRELLRAHHASGRTPNAVDLVSLIASRRAAVCVIAQEAGPLDAATREILRRALVAGLADGILSLCDEATDAEGGQ